MCSHQHTKHSVSHIPIPVDGTYARYTIAATALRISANGLAKLAKSIAPLVGGALEPLPVPVPVEPEPVVVVVASVDDAAVEEVVPLSVGLLIVVFLCNAVPVAIPLAPEPATPVPMAPEPNALPTVVVALLAATVVVTEVLFTVARADCKIALADVTDDVVVVEAEEAEEAEEEVPPERAKRPE